MNRLLFLYTLVLLQVASTCFGQVYFSNRYDFNGGGDVGYSVIDIDTGYIVVGGTTDSSFNLRTAIWLIDTLGNEVWKKSFGKSGYNYYSGYSGSLIQTSDGGYALGTSMTDTAGDGFTLLVKYNMFGDTLWTKLFGGTFDFNNGASCGQTSDGGFIVIGTGETAGDSEVILFKTDSMGNLEWEQNYGGMGIEFGLVVDVCKDGGYILGGNTTSLGFGEADIYIIKVDSLGNEEWSKTFGDSLWDCIGNVKQTSDGGYIIGTCLALFELPVSLTQSKAYIIKLDSVGNTEWDQTYGAAALSTGQVNVHELADGSFISVGQGNDGLGTPAGNGWPEGTILKVSATGDSLWHRSYEKLLGSSSFNYLRDLKPLASGGIISVGFCAPSSPDTGTQDMWLMKLDSCGCSFPQCDTVPEASFSFTSDSLTFSFVNQSQNTNKYNWDYGDGTTSSDTNTAHTYADTGTYIVSLIARNCSRRDTMIDTITISYVGLEENLGRMDYKLTNYPNPFTDGTVISAYLPEQYGIGEVVVYNMLGNVIRRYNVNPGQNLLEVSPSELTRGVYIYSLIVDDQKLLTKKMAYIR